ncbi:hypothetical protein CERZMDRAFT_118679 [Cercospora zeae-maydis SCOH1-5]|uniref:Methyltransferase type 11 domain-containing protein n=1 Tax=Cercospora zeae-maydis SCOH1-5 TaxID=717836 RepID=A0A6A6F4T6_9PEZI|nr:hypothetical protein CERZMDRAFT_118679 [Cercospora zeae-maydis SCOH1-5]
MSSSRTHSRDSTQHSSRHHSSRIPTKTDAEHGQHNKTTQHNARLAKKTVKDATHVPPTTAGSTPTLVSMAAHKHGSDMQRFLTPVGANPSGAARMRTPSLVSGSSASTFDSPRSNTLRRKQSGAIDQFAARKRSDAGTLQLVIPSPQEQAEAEKEEEEEEGKVASRQYFDESVFGILPPSTTLPAGSTAAAMCETIKYRNLTRDPPLRSYTPSVTPSTRYTDSPFSHVPTPSSASSYSSGLAAVASGARPRRSSSVSQSGTHTSGTSRSDDQPQSTLLPVRESSTSSSNSTVRMVKEGIATRRQRTTDTPAVSAKGTITSPLSETPPAAGRRKLRKEPSPSKIRRQPVGVPPEFAHLNVATPVSKTPTRPRRDDVAFLSDLNTPAPVIQSDLPRLYTGYHKRTSSQESSILESASSVKSRFAYPPRSSSRGASASPRVDSAISPLHPALRPAQQDSSNSSWQGAPSKNSLRGQRKDSPAVGTAPSPAKSPRFGFFSRKPKTDTKAAEKPRRLSSKGPVAGTGHEGYGRFGFRGRSTSTTSSTTSRSPSSDSTTNTVGHGSATRRSSRNSKESTELDPFLKERLKPRYLRGSGSTWGQTESMSSANGGSVQPASSQSSISDGASLPSLLPSAMSTSSRPSLEHRPSLGRRSTQESSDDGFDARMFNYRIHASGVPLSKASLQTGAGSQARQHSFESEDGQRLWSKNEVATSPPHIAGDSEERQQQDASLARPNPNRRWNFLQRANRPPRTNGKQRDALNPAPANSTAPTPVAHYALMDAVHPVDLAEVEDLVSDLDCARDEAMKVSYRTAEREPREQRESYLLRSTEPFVPQELPSLHASSAAHFSSREKGQHAMFPKLPSNHPHRAYPALPARSGAVTSSLHTPEQDHRSPKQPRLSPVGRIPAVVSKRDRDRKLSDVSFSRPFAQKQPKPPGDVYNQIRGMAGPVDPGSHSASDQSQWPEGFVASAPEDANVSDVFRRADQPAASSSRQGEFITFPDRKNSQQSYLSGSSENRSDSTRLSTSNAQPPQQEDIWNEYDDLMDAIASDKAPATAFPLGRLYAQADPNPTATAIPHVHPPPTSTPPRIELPALPTYINSTVLTVPQQVSRFLQPSMSPLTPDTLSAWINGYGNRSTCTSFDRMSMLDISTADVPVQQGLRHSAVSSRQSTGSRHSRSTSLPDVVPYGAERASYRQRAPNVAHQAAADAGKPRTRHIDNMRFGAFMTSKWLAFGRILFSPANNELRFANEARVLVIDGLSSDWSYYIARSYPNTEVYDMSAGPKVSTGLGWDDADASTPTNFRRIPVTSLSAAFPFPRGFFNAIVLRFPTATTEHSYSACVSECRRVLRPGGYLEIAVLDLDLMNMGSQTRKAVKGLKTRMQIRDPSVCLGNLSDVLVRMVGRKGFENIQRCVVGVPAAGRVRSQDLSGSGSDSSGRTLWRRSHVSSAADGSHFLDLFNDTEEKMPDLGNNADESITKMVARVGRWWYSNCYERALLPADQSIWSERGLLRECEKQRTSFRLLICQAQKPLQTRRRTVSV